MSILDKSVEQQHAVTAVANTVGINLSANAKAPDAINLSNTAKPVDVAQHVASAASANKDASQKLGQIADIKHSLAQQMPDGQGGEQRKSALMSESDPKGSGIARGAASAGLAALGIAMPTVGLAMAAVETVKFAAAPVAQHAGLTHAAIDAAPSAFKTGSSLSDKKASAKDPIIDSYTDSSGDTYAGGFKTTQRAPQITTPAGNQLELGIQMASKDVIGKMGTEKVKKDLGSMSAAEENLERQVGSSAKQLQDLGVQPQQMAKLGVRPPAGPGGGPGMM